MLLRTWPCLRAVLSLSELAVLRRLVVVLLRLEPCLRTVLYPSDSMVLRRLVMVLPRAILSWRTVLSQQLAVPLPWGPCLRSVALPTSLSSPLTTGLASQATVALVYMLIDVTQFYTVRVDLTDAAPNATYNITINIPPP